MQPWYVIDFDSTFVQVEALEELARIALKGHPDRKRTIAQIEELTHLGIEGKISFTEGLRRRLALIGAHRDHLEPLISALRKKVSLSIRRNANFFAQHRDRILIVSAGFRDFIAPIVADFGIPAEQVHANTFTFDRKGKITGFDERNPLSLTDGKAKQLALLKLKGPVYILGDGYSDFQMKKVGKNVSFFAFTENVERLTAVQGADHVTPSFDEFLYHHQLPMSLSYPKNRIKVLLLENIHPRAVALFKEEGYQVEALSHSLGEEELKAAIKGVSVLGIRSKTQVSAEVLRHADRLIAIGAFCIGTNQIDLDAALLKGIAAFNAPYSNTRSVVELVIGQMVMLMRDIPDKSRDMHQGIWTKSAAHSYELRGKTLGIVGYGKIGSQLSVLAEALGMRVMFYDKADRLALGNAVRCATLQEVLKKSDVVTLHVDGDKSNQDFFGAAEFKAMKKGSYFLNLSRGFVVDVPALVKHLKSGKIQGASVDVFPYEPKSNEERFVTPLQGLRNVILTPHIGGSTLEAQEDIAGYVPEKIMQYVNTGNTYASVNFPNLQLPVQHDAHRLIHIHNNVPGILARINSTLSKHKINILGQYLKTNEHIGYVITDINKKYDEKVMKELREIEDTIKFRVLF
jgi:D-3-phosphoglycerate dehydrogenase